MNDFNFEDTYSLWSRVRTILSQTMIPAQFQAWIAPLVPLRVIENRSRLEVQVIAPNCFSVTHINRRHKARISKAVELIAGQRASVECKVC